MKVAIRVDSSLEMGTGHIMRSLTLAEELRKSGVDVKFISRPHLGNILSIVEDKGFIVCRLNQSINNTDSSLYHSSWLGASQTYDADQTLACLEDEYYDWLIVDHYAIDVQWEKRIARYCKKIMVIDDLADRYHFCDLLLDQNYGSIDIKYNNLVPPHTKLLIGSKYSLLRAEFSEWRNRSLARRENCQSIRTIFVSMGGTDPNNLTEKVLDSISLAGLNNLNKVVVVMGGSSAHIDSVMKKARSMCVATEVKVNAGNVAILMTDSDLAIGAAGSTSWERCCLGLPTIQLITAENQKSVATHLSNKGAVIAANSIVELPGLIASSEKKLTKLSNTSKSICNGNGAKLVVDNLMETK